MATAASRWQPPRPLPPPPGRGVAARDPREGVGGARRPDPRPGVRPRGSAGRGGGGSLTPPAHPHPAAPGLGARRGGATPPPDRPLWAGGCTGRGWNPGRGQRDRLPPPKTRPPPAPCWRRRWLQDLRRPARTPHRVGAPHAGSRRPQSPALAPGEVTRLHGPSPGAAPPPNLPPSPALGRRGFHAGGDSPRKATSNTRTPVGGGRD